MIRDDRTTRFAPDRRHEPDRLFQPMDMWVTVCGLGSAVALVGGYQLLLLLLRWLAQ